MLCALQKASSSTLAGEAALYKCQGTCEEETGRGGGVRR